ncbi:MAG: hypothetical protein ACK59C_06445 [Holosporales bacterium]
MPFPDLFVLSFYSQTLVGKAIVPSDGTNIVVKEEKYNAFVDVEAALKAALPSGLQSQVTFQEIMNYRC